VSTAGIIGCGRLGTRIAEECLRNNIFDEIFLENRSGDRLTGILRSLRLWANLEGYQSLLQRFNWNNFDQIDYIIIATKDNYDPRLIRPDDYLSGFPLDLRYAGLYYDLPIIDSIASKLEGYTGTIIVLSNPVDLLVSFIGRKLPSATVLGLGLGLDCARVAYSIPKSHLGEKSSLKQLPLVGPHGPEAQPVLNSPEWRELVIRYGQAAVGEWVSIGLSMGYLTVKELGYTLHECGTVFRHDIEWITEKQHLHGARCLSLAFEGTSSGGPIERISDREFEPVAIDSEDYIQMAQLCKHRFSDECDRLLKYLH